MVILPISKNQKKNNSNFKTNISNTNPPRYISKGFIIIIFTF